MEKSVAQPVEMEREEEEHDAEKRNDNVESLTSGSRSNHDECNSDGQPSEKETLHDAYDDDDDYDEASIMLMTMTIMMMHR